MFACEHACRENEEATGGRERGRREGPARYHQMGGLVSFLGGIHAGCRKMWYIMDAKYKMRSRLCHADCRTFGSMQSSLQSRLVVQNTMIRLLPPAPYTLTMSLIVLDRLFIYRDGDREHGNITKTVLN